MKQKLFAFIEYVYNSIQSKNEKLEMSTDNPGLPIYRYKVTIYTGAGVIKVHQSAHDMKQAQELALRNYYLTVKARVTIA